MSAFEKYWNRLLYSALNDGPEKTTYKVLVREAYCDALQLAIEIIAKTPDRNEAIALLEKEKNV